MSAPQLRFKEFDGNWSSNQLGKIIGISSASRVFKEQWQDSGVPFFRTSDVISIFKNKENEKVYISFELFEELAKKSGKINKDDLLVTGGGTIGIPYLVPNDQPLYFKDADLLWMKSSGIIEGSFLYNFLISPKFREYLNSISHTGTISHFTIEQAKATPFSFPSKAEQTKIASFLSVVDEKIGQLTKKHELLSQYKQGMMQKLFSQQVRFKADDGSEFGEWEYKELGLLLDYEQPTKYIVSSTDYDNYFPTPVLTAGKTFILGYTNEQHGIFNAESQNVIIFDDFTTAYKFVNFNFKVKSSAMKILKTDPRKNNIFYLYSTFSTLFLSLGDEHKRRWISEYSKLEVPVPCLEEQTKIANFLSVIDQKIEKVAQQIEETKQWKKGLLQQMFV